MPYRLWDEVALSTGLLGRTETVAASQARHHLRTHAYLVLAVFLMLNDVIELWIHVLQALVQ